MMAPAWRVNKNSIWKHHTHGPLPRNEVTNIAVFDDELPGQVTLYQTDGTRFCACRSVVIASDRYRDCLLAWAATAPLLDLRNDKTVPLPTPFVNSEAAGDVQGAIGAIQ